MTSDPLSKTPEHPELGFFRWEIAGLVIPVILYFCFTSVSGHQHLELMPSSGTSHPPSQLQFQSYSLGESSDIPPWITNVQIVDLDQDGRKDIISCDARFDRVLWFQRSVDGAWREKMIAGDLPGPAHATVVDFDSDGDLDIIVSVLGRISPNDENIGSLVYLENQDLTFVAHTILTNVRRIADAQAGDLDGDGDLDLSVAVFGYARGEILWLENRGHQEWRSHQLFVAAGTVHVPIADFDGDGDLDIAAVVSQDDEEVWAFENIKPGHFAPRLLFRSPNPDLGSAGLVRADLDGDGDQDLILPVGDNLEDLYSYPQKYHGCLWLENQGGWNFKSKKIATVGGTYAAAVGDLDGDGDQDVVLASMFNDWDSERHSSLVYLQNDGKQNFSTFQIAERPTHLVTVGCGDLNSDCRDDIVAGAMCVAPPFSHFSGTTVWQSRAKSP